MVALESFAQDLFRVLNHADPRSPRELYERAHDEVIRLLVALEELRRHRRTPEGLEGLLGATQDNLQRLSTALREGLDWRELHIALGRNYSQLVKALDRGAVSARRALPRLAPRNFVRNAFHIGSGLGAALIYHLWLDRTGAIWVMAILTGFFSLLELARWRSGRVNELLMRAPFLKHIARPDEYDRVNSATLFAWGVLIAVIFASQGAVEAGCLVLAFGDPAASLIGKRWGKTKLIAGKSLEGTLAFAVVGGLAVLVFRLLAYPGEPLLPSLLVAGGAAAIGASVELFSIRIDDNFAIPLAVALGLTVLGL